MVFGACSDIGKVRKANQDYYCVKENNGYSLYVVADGMGGHNAGEVASFMAIRSIENWFEKNFNIEKVDHSNVLRIIEEAISHANSEIFDAASKNSELFGMGTTITLALIIDNNLYLGHVGDSRAYLINQSEIIQLTEDHSLVAELYKNGSITTEEATNHPQKHMLTRALGTDESIKVDILNYYLRDNDYLLLCTDGLTNLIDNNQIKDIVLKHGVGYGCDELAKTANLEGGFDNITVILVKYNSAILE